MEVIAGVIRAYYDALLGAEQLNATNQAMRSAEADLERAEAVRSAGMSTDADVLSIRVHLAGVREQQIRSAADLDVARAALNDALGLPLDTAHTLSTALTPLKLPDGTAGGLRKERPPREAGGSPGEARHQSGRNPGGHGAQQPSAAGRRSRRFRGRPAALLRPRRRQLAGLDRRCVGTCSTASATRRASRKARFALRRSEAEQERAGSAIRLQVRRAYADLRAADQRIEVAQASVAEAEESLRITQNRYEAGMSNVTDLLRTETAVLEARTRHLAAIHDQRIAAAMLELAAGTLTVDSEVLNEGHDEKSPVPDSRRDLAGRLRRSAEGEGRRSFSTPRSPFPR